MTFYLSQQFRGFSILSISWIMKLHQQMLEENIVLYFLNWLKITS